MLCTNCGKTIPDDVKFCSHCGASQPAAAPAAEKAPDPTPQEAPRLDKPAGSIGQRLLGLLFLVGAIVAGITPRWMNFLYFSDLQELHSLGEAYISAVPVFVSFLNLLNTFVFMLAAVICLAAGMALLMGCSGARKAAITAVVFQGLTLLYIPVVLVICMAVPNVLMGFLSIPAKYINDAANYIRSESSLSGRYLYALFSQAAIFALLIFVTTRLRTRGQKLDRGIMGLLITLPFLAFVLTISGNMDSAFINAHSYSVVLAYSIATTAISEATFLEITWVWLALAMIFGLLLRKKKFSSLVIGMAAVMLVSIVVIALRTDIESAIENYETLGIDDLEDLAPLFMVMKLVGSGALLLAFGLWVAASAKGAIPLWVQIPVSILLFMPLYTLHFVGSMILHLPPWLPAAKLIVALILGAISIPLGIHADKKLQTSQNV